MGIPEDTKSKIYQEEKYRIEVRKQLELETKSKNRIFEFLNTPLGLWLLSSVVMASITAAVTYHIKSEEKEKAKIQLVKKLYIEISHRIVASEAKWIDLKTKNSLVLEPLQLRRRKNDSPDPEKFTSAFREFQKYGFYELINEIEWAGPEKRNKENSDKLKKKVKFIENCITVTDADCEEDQITEEYKKAKKLTAPSAWCWWFSCT